MGALKAAQAYFEAWNARDGAALIASLGGDGTYADPTTGGALSGVALTAHVEALWAAFPDLGFEITSLAETGGGRLAAEWVMRGTNSGSFRGLPPTGRRVELAGADFIETANDKVRAVVGYFDSAAVPRQLGLQVVVQPHEAGPFRFGESAAVQSGRTDAPGAYSITQLEAVDDAQATNVRNLSRRVLTEMLGMPGFIGAVTAKIGLRMVTVSAWDHPDDPKRLTREGSHVEAMKPFFQGSLAKSAITSVWTPTRISPYWIRCAACRKMHDPAKSGPTCDCGAALPDPPPYW